MFLLFTGHRRDREKGDDSFTGVIESRPFVLQGDRISLLVGGGAGLDTYIAVCTATGDELLKAHGRNGPALHRVVWDVRPHIGKVLKLRIVDRSTAGWGHVTIDDVSCQGKAKNSD